MRILIADDERPSRGELKYILSQLASGATFYEAANGQAALELIAGQPVDVAFLDINMPVMTGLAAAAAIVELPEPPLIVFATAYDAHAVRAYELAALDYVVKPFDERRLAQTMVRIRSALAGREQRDARHRATRAYLAQAAPVVTKLWGERENKTAVLVDYDDIMWIEAREKKVYLHDGSGDELLLRFTIKELLSRLAPHGFARVHKAYLVNLNQVAEIVPWFSGTYLARMRDEAATELPVSRQYGKQLKQLMGV